jgi:tricorn protease
MRRVRLAAAVLLALAGLAGGASRAAEEPPETLLLQEPTVSADSVVFKYAEDLWVVGREGGVARRLTSSPGEEGNPRLSPDGKRVAFNGQYEGNTDVYVLPLTGGSPRRLTWYPGDDAVRGWHPDGKRVLFLTARDSGVPAARLGLAGLEEGGLPEMLPIPRAFHASWREDGKRIAYTPWRDPFRTWKRYRGGMTVPIWVCDPATLEVEQVPHGNWSDTFPCWVGETVWFASDRDGVMNVWKWTPGEKEAEQVTQFKDFGVRNMSSGAGTVVFERAGAIHLLDPKTGDVKRLRISVLDDGLASNPRWVPVKDSVRDGDPSPNGKRAVIEARGEILTAPREHGDVRDLTRSPGAHDRSPAWSPDGERIAWFSDAGGEYRLLVGDAPGKGEPRAYDCGGVRFYFQPRWSPDGKHVLFTDKGNRIAFVTLESGKVTEVASVAGDLGYFEPGAAWSPDSKWIAFEQRNPGTLYDRIALFEVATGKVAPVTDAFATAYAPAFSRDGKLLFFAASVDSGPARFGLDLSSSTVHKTESSLYVVVLQRAGKNPLAPPSDEAKEPGEAGKGDGKEPAKEEKKDAPKEEGKEGKKEDGKDGKKEEPPALDLEGIDQRILALPGAEGEVYYLRCTADRLLYLERTSGPEDDQFAGTLWAYDLEERKPTSLVEGVEWFRVSGDGKSLLYRKEGALFLSDGQAKEPKRLALDGARVRCEPRQEWPEILREAWRFQRDFFYDPAFHGTDWNAMWDRWSAFLPHVRNRGDLNVVMGEMIGELCCGHEYLWGGEKDPAPAGVGSGLLGADWEVADGRYRIRRIFRGQNWNPGLRAPLTEPGVEAREGDYLVAVEGRPVTAAGDLHRAFENTAGKQIEITVSAKADGSAPRVTKVVPVGPEDEGRLRRLAWVEERRRMVDRLSGGALAYVYMPDTGGRGLAAFDRDFYSQLDRKGLVLDERYNGGGKVADYVVDVLSRKVLCWWMSREGWVGRTPWGTLQGPKVMLINERAGSGGDAMPWMFRQMGIGPLVGTRTWGGLVGITGYPPLMDGGSVTAAAFGILDPSGKWVVENEGVAPDVEVVEWPKDCAEGRDPQLEKAVEVAMDLLKNTSRVEPPRYQPPAKR